MAISIMQDNLRQDSIPEAALENKDQGIQGTANKLSFPRKFLDKIGLNLGVLLLMTKGALPPTIAIALFQDSSFAMTYSTLGYLVAVMSLLSFPIMPRAKFIQTMVLNIVGTCIGAAVALLAIYCSVQARAHTTHTSQKSSSGGPSPGAQVATYNSSASAICALWLFANIYISNSLRASRPALQFPVILYSIFINVAVTYAPQFGTMKQGMAFTKSLIEAFISGFAISAVISLFVFPMTSRSIVLEQTAGFISGLQGALKAQAGYLQSLETKDMFGASLKHQEEPINGDSHELHKEHQAAQQKKSTTSLESQKLRTAISALGELHSKLGGELTFAKREIAYGKFDAEDLKELFKLCRSVLIPITGMSSIAEIFDRAAERYGWSSMSSESQNKSQGTNSAEKMKEKEITQWNNIMKTLHSSFEIMTEALDEGLQHALFTLQLASPKNEKEILKLQVADQTQATHDVEEQGDSIRPGDAGFATYLTTKIDNFYNQRKLTLAIWCKQRGILLDENLFKNPVIAAPHIHIENEDVWQHQRGQRQLYLILYMEFLLWSTGRAVLDLVRFADRKVEEGVTKKKRFIFPGLKRTKKWFSSAVKIEDTNLEQTPDDAETGGTGIYVGESFKAAKDPEHLPPKNSWERFGKLLRGISNQLASPESAFGFRVACATLTIGIVAYLHDTQQFFIRQRLVWAMIMVAIGMTATAGSGIFGFIGRVVGTAIAMCTSLVIWYLIDGKTGGVITMLWFFIFVEFYFVIKFPRFIVIALLSTTTQILIIGYELEVRKLGAKVATSTGQPAYPTYLLAPYRLICVTGGMLVAFIWTFFPYPITNRSQLRKDLGISLYLLANYYSIVHTTVGMRIRGEEGDVNDKTSPGRKLEKARTKVYTKQMALLEGLRQHSAFTSWEPTLGGKFPKAQYDTIIQEVQNILNYLSLISYATKYFSDSSSGTPSQKPWLKDLVALLESINVTSQEITSILALLSASVSNGTSLPPYLRSPTSFKLTERLEALDADILGIHHIAEPGYAAFAVMQTASSLVNDDMENLIKNIKDLVGEVDFSFHVISTTSESDDSLAAATSEKGKMD